jgi:hypothetical protein
VAHRRVTLGVVLVTYQAALLDRFALNVLVLQQDGLPPVEMGIGRGQIIQALVIARAIILLDKGINLGLKGGNRCLRPTLHRNLLIVPFAPLTRTGGGCGG